MFWKLPGMWLVLLASLLSATLYYRHHYQQAEKARQTAVSEIERHQVSLEQLRQKIKTVSQLDAQYNEALEHHKNRVAQLERDVADGRRRLRVKATCPNMSAYSSASRVDDAAPARLADPAQRDYFRLRNRIDIAGQQINGLQDYIRQVCLRDPQARPNP
ncbi:lysis protein [Candidatus Williamhamiltonella defendens]|uniref:Peptidase n=2 Tax=Candidatus Williamhamiltonella defendens TaxID=138072 RepID=A0A249DWT2_9ENTR|nr:lysis protein [Candidatus Hamiltonella defensa]ASX25787.1 peptidase [Candidatus Hamiltonella defensa (Bemisia tabaci)]ASX26013.1 peptidase [Candidatus Hamiltonella defensa (Bemisia tabaci)]